MQWISLRSATSLLVLVMTISGCASRDMSKGAPRVTSPPPSTSTPADPSPIASVDYAKDAAANAAAAIETEKLHPHLQGRADFGGMQIVAAGIRISETDGQLEPYVRSIVGPNPRVPVVYRAVRRSLRTPDRPDGAPRSGP
ncbi:MAG: hypothetical protein ACRDVG_11355 [Jatrophihabitantaceae bacterium]